MAAQWMTDQVSLVSEAHLEDRAEGALELLVAVVGLLAHSISDLAAVDGVVAHAEAIVLAYDLVVAAVAAAAAVGNELVLEEAVGVFEKACLPKLRMGHGCK